MTGRKIVYILFIVFLMNKGYGQTIDSLGKTKYLPEDSSKVKVRRLNLNSDRSDFSPVLSGNTLFFASGRPSALVVSYANELNTEITDIYSATKKDSVNFSKVRPISKIINTKVNEGSSTLNKKGDTIYFSGNARPGRATGQNINRLQIFTSGKTADEWSTPQLAGFCDSSYSSFHPALSANNKIMVFCSDMPGGYGGIDLYITRLVNNVWTKPLNLGNKINSTDNELFPFMSGDSQLYFSSKRSTGFGGLDIYSAGLDSTGLNEATPLLPPVNSGFDDFGIFTDTTGKSGYFTSNRKTSSGDDIYYFYIAYPDFSKASTPPVKNKFCYTFFEENNYQSNDSVSMAYEWDFGNGHKIREDKCRYCFDKPGDYPIQLNVVEKNSGEVFFNQVTYTLTVDAPPALLINCTDTAAVGAEVLFDAERSAVKGYRLIDFYWSLGDGKYNSGPFAKHTYRKGGTYTVELGVIARNAQTNKIEKFKIEKNITIKETI